MGHETGVIDFDVSNGRAWCINYRTSVELIIDNLSKEVFLRWVFFFRNQIH